MKENIYEYFDIDEKADKETVKKAFRRKAKETHPDTNNNKNDDFQKTKKYYMILADPEKRKKYDETGEIDEKSEKGNLYISLLAELFKNLVQSRDTFNFDMFKAMMDKLDTNIASMEQGIEKAKKSIEKLQKLEKKITPKKNNIFINVLREGISAYKEGIVSHKKQIKIQKDAYDFIKKGKFKFKYENEYESTFGDLGGAFVRMTP